MELELKHIAPYLPYGLKIVQGGTLQAPDAISIVMNCESCQQVVNHWFTPILRPISNLTMLLERGTKKIVPLNFLLTLIGVDESDAAYSLLNVKMISTSWKDNTFFYNQIDRSFYWINREDMLPVKNQLDLFQELFAWHFDVFGLIEQGLAIDINTLS